MTMSGWKPTISLIHPPTPYYCSAISSFGFVVSLFSFVISSNTVSRKHRKLRICDKMDGRNTIRNWTLERRQTCYLKGYIWEDKVGNFERLGAPAYEAFRLIQRVTVAELDSKTPRPGSFTKSDITEDFKDVFQALVNMKESITLKRNTRGATGKANTLCRGSQTERNTGKTGKAKRHFTSWLSNGLDQ